MGFLEKIKPKPFKSVPMPEPDPGEQEQIYAEYGRNYRKRGFLFVCLLLSVGGAILLLQHIGMPAFFLPFIALIAMWKPLLQNAYCPWCKHDFREPGGNKSYGGRCYSCGVKLRKSIWF